VVRGAREGATIARRVRDIDQATKHRRLLQRHGWSVAVEDDDKTNEEEGRHEKPGETERDGR
jgi:hypothetical protein